MGKRRETNIEKKETGIILDIMKNDCKDYKLRILALVCAEFLEREKSLAKGEEPEKKERRHTYSLQYKELLKEAKPPYELIKTLCEDSATQFSHIVDKQLTETDTNRHHNRLFLPKKQIKEALAPMLPYEMRLKLLGDEEKKMEPEVIDIIVIDQMGRKWNLKLKSWKCSSFAVFGNGQWISFVEKHMLQAKVDTVRVWAFLLANEKLGLIIGIKD